MEYIHLQSFIKRKPGQLSPTPSLTPSPQPEHEGVVAPFPITVSPSRTRVLSDGEREQAARDALGCFVMKEEKTKSVSVREEKPVSSIERAKALTNSQAPPRGSSGSAAAHKGVHAANAASTNIDPLELYLTVYGIGSSEWPTGLTAAHLNSTPVVVDHIARNIFSTAEQWRSHVQALSNFGDRVLCATRPQPTQRSEKKKRKRSRKHGHHSRSRSRSRSKSSSKSRSRSSSKSKSSEDSSEEVPARLQTEQLRSEAPNARTLQYSNALPAKRNDESDDSESSSSTASLPTVPPPPAVALPINPQKAFPLSQRPNTKRVNSVRPTISHPARVLHVPRTGIDHPKERNDNAGSSDSGCDI